MIKRIEVIKLSVEVAVLSCQQRGATGGADRVTDIAFIESHTCIRNGIEIGCQVGRLKSSAVGSDGLKGVVVGKEPQYIRTIIDGNSRAHTYKK
jgi:hypothetical protein